MNIKRFQRALEELNKFGLTDKGINRLAYSETERKAISHLINLFKDEGMSVKVDEIGNVIARREGLDSSLPAVACGSHIDTVYNGGKYDGTIGVLAGLELVCYLNENEIETEHSIEVIIFACEESARFGVATIGSKVMVGLIENDNIKNLVDKNGITLNQAATAYGINIENLKAAKRENSEIKVFYELHIEQGPVLEKTSVPIGIVTGIAAPTRFNILINGQAAHSGTTPMNYRKDAFLGATEIALTLEEIVQKEAKYETVATVGECKVSPGAMNVVPGKAEMKIDIRSTSATSKNRVKQKLLQTITNMEKSRNLQISVTELSDEIPIKIDESIVQSLRESCNSLSFPYNEMSSGAGHDAMNLATMCPTGMIFVPSKDGLSHNKDEFTSMEQIIQGVKVLIDIMMKESRIKNSPILKE